MTERLVGTLMDANSAPAASPDAAHPFPARGDQRLAIIGLGYVGLPLAVEFGKRRTTVGFDIDAERIAELHAGHDHTLEVSPEELHEAIHLTFTSTVQEIQSCNVFIITVPTPIDGYHRPDLGPLLGASETVGKILKAGDVVIFESTVYPGCTEEDCVPILEKHSGLVFNRDFFCGYSPERINPGDKVHRLATIRKVTSGSTPEVAEMVDRLYNEVVTAGTHKAPSIKVAEASKITENIQRDLNIALINELALIFHKLGIDTHSVLDAAGSKWNFLPFKPGLVGGHCIGVDPYFLTHKAEGMGYHPDVILAGRRINEYMGLEVAERVVRLMVERGLPVARGRALVLGLTFKENCPDVRNTRVFDILRILGGYGLEVDVYDPWIDRIEVRQEYGIEPLAEPPEPGSGYSAVILAVNHDELASLGAARLRALGLPDAVLFDVKGVFPLGQADGRL
jgi:UDP-N-acetyl-D-galactosamine dehydrogenase